MLTIYAREFEVCGASGETRTPDMLLTRQLLYQLSYASIRDAKRLI